MSLATVKGDMFDRCEFFDEADLDAALARFDELSRPPSQLENAATRTYERMWVFFERRDWETITDLVAEDELVDDRRRVVNGGVRHGREAGVGELQAAADIGFAISMVDVKATRGERLALTLVRASGRDSAAIENDVLQVVAVDADDRIAAVVTFDANDVDAAFAELDTRYAAGEAAAYAHTWSVITDVLVAHNKREIAPATPDMVSIDHRKVAAFAPGEGPDYIRAGWDLDQSLDIYIETVHRVNELGAVFTWTGRGSSRDGFNAEWRGINLMTVEGEKLSRTEVFDEADVHTAVAKFEQLSRPVRRPENKASQVADRFSAHLAAGNWDALAGMLADDFTNDDRRRVTGSGVLNRDAQMANTHAIAELWSNAVTSTTIATRGQRLALVQLGLSNADPGPEPFQLEVLGVLEIGPDDRMTTFVTLDADDFDAALTELDARYLAGEAGPHARTWSAVSASYAAINRHELPPTTPDWVSVEHRREVNMGTDDLFAYIGAGTARNPDVAIYVEAVHRLESRGAVVTYTAQETSREGFAAEWRGLALLVVEGELISRTEVFDEATLDAALATFEESAPTTGLENAATRVFGQLYSNIAAGDWNTVTRISAENVAVEDRRRVVNAGILHGRDAAIKDARATVDVGFTMTMLDVLAIRGTRLALTGVRVSGRDPQTVQNDALQVIEIDTEERVAGVVVFDLDEMDAAIAELDARYLAGEAADFAHTWSRVAGGYAAFNRREIFATTPNWVNIDHRRAAAFASGDMIEYLQAAWGDSPDTRIYIAAVHRLDKVGAVVTHVARGMSREGFDAEWRDVHLLALEGELFSRSELFDGADVGRATARFDELARATPRLENTATLATERLRVCFAARDWNALADMFAEDIVADDRRRVVGLGIRRGRQVNVADIRVGADIGTEDITSTVIATRGERLSLDRARFCLHDQQLDTLSMELLRLVEVDANGRMTGCVMLDVDELDAAIAELDARYLAGEAAPHSSVWSVFVDGYAALNRHELPLLTRDALTVDHRRARNFGTGELSVYLDASWQLMPDASLYVAAVYRLSHAGAVVSQVVHGTTQDGFDAEWRELTVLKSAGDRVSRCEMFDEEDLDTALARFDELHQPEQRLKKAAAERFLAHFAARDWDAIAQDFAENYYCDDRRRVVNAGIRRGRDAAVEDLRVSSELGLLTSITMEIIATRGERHFVTRWCGSGPDRDTFHQEVLQVVEIDDDQRFATAVLFDLEDFDAAIAEIDARYIAGEAAAHAGAWSTIAEVFAAINRRELPATSPDFTDVDHRPLAAIGSGDLMAYLSVVMTEGVPRSRIYVEAVHRLTDFGAVTTHVAEGTSLDGFDAEWRITSVFTLDNGIINRYEYFEESDLEAALARFEELSRPAPLLENAATQLWARLTEAFNRRDLEGYLALGTSDVRYEDRRPGLRDQFEGRAEQRRAVLALFGATTSSIQMAAETLAVRGPDLALTRVLYRDTDYPDRPVTVEMLQIVEVDGEGRLHYSVSFDPDDVDAAFDELDARYLAGEAAN